MHLSHLSLTNFRNYARLDVEVPRGPIVILGSNAQGKTSLLEAIYLLSTFTSYHATSDRDLIHFNQMREKLAVARIVAELQKAGKRHQLELRIIQESNGYSTPRVRKEFLLDGVKQKLNENVGFFNAVIFLPQMLQIVDGAPENRRRYLNLAIAQAVRHYSENLSAYMRVLSQRNALLKQLNERGGDTSQLDSWDEMLVSYGAKLIYERIKAIQELGGIAAPFHAALTRGQEVLRIDYQPSYDPLPAPQEQMSLPLNDPRDRARFTEEEIKKGFSAALYKKRGEEISRGMTSIGPHRDELRFMGNRIDLGIYGSRGQVRTTMLALKLAEAAWIQSKTGHRPVLLLDEVLAELDDTRRRDLLARIAGVEQALLTTTDVGLFDPSFVDQSRLWHVQAGQLSESAE